MIARNSSQDKAIATNQAEQSPFFINLYIKLIEKNYYLSYR